MKLDLESYTVGGGTSRQNRIHNVIDLIRELNPPEVAERLILSIVREVIENEAVKRYGVDPSDWHRDVQQLLSALRGEGWEFSGGKLIPTTAEPASLAPEISKLQRDLRELALSVAETHYEQALENFRERRFEASNGQLRSFLENLYIELCCRRSGKSFEDPIAAVQHLRQTGHIDGGEQNLARGLFEASHENGAHHGLSNAEEALFRFHFSTALGAYLIARLRNSQG